jgi:hypothetical protein
MNDITNNFAQSDEDILSFDVSDEALEAAASAIPGAAMSFPNAPTVSIVIVCCSTDGVTAR